MFFAWRVRANFGYFRLSYNILVVVICSVLYWRCILTIRGSRITKRTKLLTFAFAGNLFSWSVTVLPHLIYLDFVLEGEHLILHVYFIAQMIQSYLYLKFGQGNEQTVESEGCFRLFGD